MHMLIVMRILLCSINQKFCLSLCHYSVRAYAAGRLLSHHSKFLWTPWDGGVLMQPQWLGAFELDKFSKWFPYVYGMNRCVKVGVAVRTLSSCSLSTVAYKHETTHFSTSIWFFARQSDSLHVNLILCTLIWFFARWSDSLHVDILFTVNLTKMWICRKALLACL
jgi:hypothetical protein